MASKLLQRYGHVPSFNTDRQTATDNVITVLHTTDLIDWDV